MKIWPVPDSYQDELPKNDTPGSFWENRGDRYHCGVDIYAPDSSDVLAIQSGKVIDVGVFTSPDVNIYWNMTYYITIKTSQNMNIKYAELSETFVRIGDFVISGHVIGRVGTVLNKNNVTHNTPQYIRELISNGKVSMLHLEAYIAPISEVRPYLG